MGVHDSVRRSEAFEVRSVVNITTSIGLRAYPFLTYRYITELGVRRNPNKTSSLICYRKIPCILVLTLAGTLRGINDFMNPGDLLEDRTKVSKSLAVPPSRLLQS